MFSGYDEKQKSANRDPLQKGAEYFACLCAFDAARIHKEIDEEIALVEKKIEEAKIGNKER